MTNVKRGGKEEDAPRDGFFHRKTERNSSAAHGKYQKGTDTRAIVSFSHFHDLIEEAGDQETAVDYWSYLKLKVKRLESQWIAKAKAADANIASAKVKKETRRH